MPFVIGALVIVGLVAFMSQAHATGGAGTFPTIQPMHVYNVQFHWTGGGFGPIPAAVLAADWGPLGIVPVGLTVQVGANGIGNAQVQAIPTVLQGHFLDTQTTHWTNVADLGAMGPQPLAA